MINKNYTYCWNFKIYSIVCSGFGTTTVWDLPWTIQVYLKYMEKIKIEELIILCVSYSEYGVVYGTTTVWDLPWAIQVYSKYMEKIKLEELIILCVSYSEFGAIIAYNPRLYILRLNSTPPQF